MEKAADLEDQCRKARLGPEGVNPNPNAMPIVINPTIVPNVPTSNLTKSFQSRGRSVKLSYLFVDRICKHLLRNSAAALRCQFFGDFSGLFNFKFITSSNLTISLLKSINKFLPIVLSNCIPAKIDPFG